MVEFGKNMFQDPAAGNCSACHNNGGANVPTAPGIPPFVAGKNALVNTGVEHTVNPPAYWIYPDIPTDGGFGKPPENGPVIPGVGQGWGDGTFDSPVVIEAAITPPYFHNNSVATIEAAVGFYCSPEFQERTQFPPPVGVNFAPITLKLI
jgi:cytochrome c peroxidase